MHILGGHIACMRLASYPTCRKGKMLVLDRTIITHEAEPTEESAFLLTLAYAEKG